MREYKDNFTDLAKKSVSDFVLYNCGAEQCASGQFYGPRRRAYHFIHFVLSGSGTLEIAGTSYPVEEGQLFIVPSGELSTYRASETNPWYYSWIGFLGTRSVQFINALMNCAPKRFVLDCPNAAHYADRIDSILSLEVNGIAKHLRSNGMLYDVIGSLLGENNADEPRQFGLTIPALARKHMELHFQDVLSIADVADAVGVHANYLAQVFRKEYHISPKQYLTNLRVQKARELLTDTNDPIYIVANSVGFPDPLAFSKFFRRITGLSPSDYRNKKKREESNCIQKGACGEQGPTD